jgi:hypothetical protein
LSPKQFPDIEVGPIRNAIVIIGLLGRPYPNTVSRNEVNDGAGVNAGIVMAVSVSNIAGSTHYSDCTPVLLNRKVRVHPLAIGTVIRVGPDLIHPGLLDSHGRPVESIGSVSDLGVVPRYVCATVYIVVCSFGKKDLVGISNFRSVLSVQRISVPRNID